MAARATLARVKSRCRNRLIGRSGSRSVRCSTTTNAVLSVVQEQPGSINQKAVADLLGTTPATISRQLEVGTRSGLLAVSTSNPSRRANEVTLTPAGEQAVERADAIIVRPGQG